MSEGKEMMIPQSEESIAIFDERFSELQKQLRKSSRARRKKETPPSARKSREIGEGKTAEYVPRALWQKELDENFPGWSLLPYPATRFWVEYLENETGKTPFLYCCQVSIRIIENSVARNLVGIGSQAVSSKEMVDRGNSQLHSKKFAAALTYAIETALGWVGLFFDLRANEEDLDSKMQGITPEQTKLFNELLESVPLEHKPLIKKKFEDTYGKYTDEFLANLAVKVNQLKKKESTNVRPTEPTTP